MATELSNTTLYVTIVSAFELPGDIFILPRQQFVFKGIKTMVPEYIGCGTREELHQVGELCEADYYTDPTTSSLVKEIYIPDRFCVLSHECIDSSEVSIPDYIQSRDMDDTKDYMTKVKSTLGIDMRANYLIQRNLDKYDEELFPVKKLKDAEYRKDEE